MFFTFPVWIFQAIHIRKQAIRLPEIKNLPTEDFGQNNTHVIILGDSVAAGVGVNHVNESLGGAIQGELHEKLADNVFLKVYAKSGDKIADLYEQLKERTFTHDKYAVISIGVNDVTGFTSVKEWQKYLIKILNMLNEHGQTHVVILGVPPMQHFPLLPFPLATILGHRAKRLNKATMQVINRYKHVDFLDINIDLDPTLFATDGFHPSAKSCRLIAKQVINFLIK